MSALSNLKILDFSTLLPGPFATLALADLGAEVLRVEAPNRVDLTRELGAKDGDASYIHRYLNRSKKSIALDLKNNQSTDIIKTLIGQYDIVIEQFRPGVMKKLGLDYESLKAVNSKIIYCSLTGYGQTGPYKDRAGHDNNYLSIAGIQDYSRRKNQAPIPAGIQIADVAGGSMHLVVGLLAAVIQRLETGEGQYLDISITDAAFTLNAMSSASYLGAGIETGPEQELLNGQQFYDYYETQDQRYLSIGGLEPKFRLGLCEALDVPHLTGMAMSQEIAEQLAFKDQLSDIFKMKNFKEWQTFFRKLDICIEPVLTLTEACSHEQIKSRNMIIEVDGIAQIGCAINMSKSEPCYRFKGVDLGDNNNILTEQFSYSPEQFKQFKSAGVFGKYTEE
ncbi:MAG: CaiB/BaiF CoA-transferase family protein [Colwellia sp.]|jgi:Predicted acyl-CoA transferases/carnitine dehydratase